MAIPFKRMGRKDPRKTDGMVKFHPQLVTQGQSVDPNKLAYTMKDKSSLSPGDIQSVLTNLVEAMRMALLDGTIWHEGRKSLQKGTKKERIIPLHLKESPLMGFFFFFIFHLLVT